ncbi:hypothetical protein KJ780_04160, partial [Candidatus Micrarchaeota archaeon]|nr:hypothetical protein [Candidatus Micrarchaeota archaeon]
DQRKKTVEDRLAAQIQVVDEVVKELEKKKNIKKELARLPPLSRIRMESILRRRRNRGVVRNLLTKDLEFLGASKKIISGMRVLDVLRIALKLKKD